jgi:hypothetical protein
MTPPIACPDCGTPNRPDADLCVQCWRTLTDEDLMSKFPTAAFAAPAPPPPPAARTVVPARSAPAPAPEPVTPREVTAGPVPYFAPAAACATPTTGYSIPARPSAAPAPVAKKLPWGGLIKVAALVALLGVGYHFFQNRYSGEFSPDDGAYSVTLPKGWEPLDEVEEAQPMIDVAVTTGDDTQAIMVGHEEIPPAAQGMTKEDLQAGMAWAKGLMPQFPGFSMGSIQDSTAVTGPGVRAYELSAAVDGTMLPGGDAARIRMVFVVRDGAPNMGFLMVVCAEKACPKAQTTFQQVARTFELSA